jgi:hypothetical protein
MKKIFLISLIFLVIFSFTFAFNISDYLYTNEKVEDITSITIKASDGEYTLYSLKNTPILLVSSLGEIVDDYKKIYSILEDNLAYNVLFSNEDKEAIKQNLDAFSKSRDLPISKVSTFKSDYGTETWCLRSLALESKPCFSQKECLVTGSLVCSLFIQGGGSGQCDAELLGALIYEYYSQILALNEKTKQIEQALDLMNLKNANEQYNLIINSAEAMIQAAKKIENSDIMYEKEIGVCFTPKFDYGALEKIKQITQKYYEKSSSIGEIEATTKIISSNTQDRKTYFSNKNVLNSLKPRWEDIKAKYSYLLEKSNKYFEVFSESEYVELHKKFTSAWSDTENMFSSYNADGLDEKLSLLESLGPKLSKVLNSLENDYKGVLEAQKKASNALIFAKYSTINSKDKSVLGAYNELLGKFNNLDKQISSNLKKSDLDNLKKQYEQLELQLGSISKKSEPNPLSLVGEKFSQSSIGIAFSITDALITLPANQKQQFSSAIPAIFLILIDFAIIASVSVIFFGLVIKFKPILKQRNIATLWVSSFLLFLFFVLIASVAFYLVIDSYSKSATIIDFIDLIKNSPNTYVVVNSVSVSPENLNSMLTCAKNISNAIKNTYNKSVDLVVLQANGCSINDKPSSFDKCVANVLSYPSVELSYSSASKPTVEFLVVYEKRTKISANKEYFDKCDFAQALSFKQNSSQ